MPKKVAKKKVKKKAKKEKTDDDDEDKPTFEVPEFKDPDIYTPRANLRITLANHISAKLGFNVTVMVTTRVEEIRQMIIDRHDGSISDITICLGSYEAVNALDPQKTLEAQGVTADADQTLIYDFKPISNPLLITPLNSGIKDESESAQKGIDSAMAEARNRVTGSYNLTKY